MSKLASGEEPLSISFFGYYAIVLAILFIYAILWQQVLKRMDLTSAFSNKSVVIIWGIVWGRLIFNESVQVRMIIGSIIISIGIYFVVTEHEK